MKSRAVEWPELGSYELVCFIQSLIQSEGIIIGCPFRAETWIYKGQDRREKTFQRINLLKSAEILFRMSLENSDGSWNEVSKLYVNNNIKD